jgi:hypothetical protein
MLAVMVEMRLKAGREWLIGTADEVDWIFDGTEPGYAITSAIPPVFDAYATIALAVEKPAVKAHDQALIALLRERSPDQPWWLGYLETGADDLVFPDAPKVGLYSGWLYVLVQAGPVQAASFKDPSSWRGPLPDLMFPVDRSWLVSTLWDDDWRCVGGPAELIASMLADDRLDTRAVSLGENATPPGHQAF